MEKVKVKIAKITEATGVSIGVLIAMIGIIGSLIGFVSSVRAYQAANDEKNRSQDEQILDRKEEISLIRSDLQETLGNTRELKAQMDFLISERNRK